MALLKKFNTWTTVPNTWLRDKNLSLKAKGLLTVMNSLPDNWEFSIRGLAAILKEGKDSIQAAVHEIEEAGYLCREQVRDDQGRLSMAVYTLKENPVTDKANAQVSENPTAENSMTENSPQINKEELTKDQNIDVGGEPDNQEVVTVEKFGYNSKGEWKRLRTVYTTTDEADRIEAASETDYPEFRYWPSRARVGNGDGKMMGGVKKTCLKVSYPEGDKAKYKTINGRKCKWSTYKDANGVEHEGWLYVHTDGVCY